MVRQQHVQDVEGRSIAGRGGADRVEEGSGRVARVWPRREKPLGKRGARGEVAPALGDGRQSCGEIVGQDHGQIDHRQVAQDDRQPLGRRRTRGDGQSAAGHSSVSGSCTCRR